MTQQPGRQLDPSLPNAARTQAIGDLPARRLPRHGGSDLPIREPLPLRGNFQVDQRPMRPRTRRSGAILRALGIRVKITCPPRWEHLERVQIASTCVPAVSALA